MTVAVTGASGFIGHAVCTELIARGYDVLGVIRSLESAHFVSEGRLEYSEVGNIGSDTDWERVLTRQNGAKIDCIIHCAARAHVMDESFTNVLESYRIVNVQGTKRLVEQAAAAGVRRFVYVSSIKVNGEMTSRSTAFSHSDEARPEDPYGISKWEAEQAVSSVAECTGLEVVIVRPPLVYGPGVKGNMARLLWLVRRKIPLPVGSVHNCRSLVGLDNLVDLLIRCSEDARAVGQTFLVSDDEDLSTPELLRRLGAASDRPARLFPLPVSLLRLVGRIAGREAVVDRLIGSLRVDCTHTRSVLDWTPPVSINDGIKKMIEAT